VSTALSLAAVAGAAQAAAAVGAHYSCLKNVGSSTSSWCEGDTTNSDGIALRAPDGHVKNVLNLGTTVAVTCWFTGADAP
jgi:hypothetical protein